MSGSAEVLTCFGTVKLYKIYVYRIGFLSQDLQLIYADKCYPDVAGVSLTFEQSLPKRFKYRKNKTFVMLLNNGLSQINQLTTPGFLNVIMI